MPYIDITEIDNTQYGLSQTSNNNIVYCPINAICGTYEPTLFESYDEFAKEYGNAGCIDDLSYDYAKDILLSGFPVLCKRIEYGDVVSSASSYPGCATNYVAPSGDPATDTNKVIIYAKNHGTYMNDVKVDIAYYASAKMATVTVLKSSATMESAVFYCSNSAITAANDVADDLGSQIIAHEFRFIKITRFSEANPNRITDDLSGTNAATLTGGLDLSNLPTQAKPNGPVADLILTAYSYYDSSTTSEKELYDKYLGFLDDKYIYDVKFITMGGYTYVLADLSTGAPPANQYKTFKGMDSLCRSRQDCFSVPDIPKDVIADKVIKHFDGNGTAANSIDTSYAAAYAPWTYNKLYNGNKAWMPPSYTFLTNLAQSVKSTPIYYPPAGVNRMLCRRTIKAEYEVGARILAQWQPKNSSGVSINPIMNIRGAGYTIYGQRTLLNLVSPVIQTSLKSVTVRFSAIEIKKAIFTACIQLTFEQNIQRTWNEFKSRVEKTLLEMKKNGGINSYQIIMDRSTISESDINNNTARGTVKVAINDALENFEVSFEIAPSYVSFDEELDAYQEAQMLNS